MSPATDGTFAVRVARKRHEAQGIASFELVHPEGHALPAFSAGAHVDVHLPGAIVRPYSICSAPHERLRYLLCVLREPASRGGSGALHDAVAVGDVLRIGAPRNLFALQPGAAHHLLLAGGIGITPLLSMAHALAHAAASFALHYAVQARERAALLADIAQAGLAPRTTLYCSDGGGSAGTRMDIGALVAGAPAGTHVYACGPVRFVQAVQAAAAAQGWDGGRVHVERFAAEAVHHDGDAAFELVLARSGRVVPVPAGRTAAEALADAGVAVPTSCEQGVCGTCLLRVTGGRPDHRDLYLSPEEQQANDQFLPCCSRSLTPRLEVDW